MAETAGGLRAAPPARCSPGSDRVLAAMRRGYTAARYLERLAAARAAIPDLAVTTDIIVGFPGETEQDFDETLAGRRRGPLRQRLHLHLLAPTGHARRRDDRRSFVPAEVVAERFARLKVGRRPLGAPGATWPGSGGPRRSSSRGRRRRTPGSSPGGRARESSSTSRPAVRRSPPGGSRRSRISSAGAPPSRRRAGRRGGARAAPPPGRHPGQHLPGEGLRGRRVVAAQPRAGAAVRHPGEDGSAGTGPRLTGRERVREGAPRRRRQEGPQPRRGRAADQRRSRPRSPS